MCRHSLTAELCDYMFAVQVSRLFKSYEFKMAENSISLLEGSDEGLFCWFAVNFLHGVFQQKLFYSCSC